MKISVYPHTVSWLLGSQMGSLGIGLAPKEARGTSIVWVDPKIVITRRYVSPTPLVDALPHYYDDRPMSSVRPDASGFIEKDGSTPLLRARIGIQRTADRTVKDARNRGLNAEAVLSLARNEAARVEKAEGRMRISAGHFISAVLFLLLKETSYHELAANELKLAASNHNEEGGNHIIGAICAELMLEIAYRFLSGLPNDDESENMRLEYENMILQGHSLASFNWYCGLDDRVISRKLKVHPKAMEAQRIMINRGLLHAGRFSGSIPMQNLLLSSALLYAKVGDSLREGLDYLRHAWYLLNATEITGETWKGFATSIQKAMGTMFVSAEACAAIKKKASDVGHPDPFLILKNLGVAARAFAEGEKVYRF